MKVYVAYPEDFTWDDFNGLVIVAENEDRALEIVKNGYYGCCYFKEHQGEIYIEEVDLTEECIVLESFHAG